MQRDSRLLMGIACSIVMGAAVTAQQEPPLPVVRRTVSSKNAFDHPALIAFVRITKTMREESGNDEPGAQFNTEDRRQIGRSVEARVLDVLRINERKPEEPGLEERYLTIVDENDRDIVSSFEIGQLYVLLLSTTPKLLRGWHPSVEQCPCLQPLPTYFLASPQGGYKLTIGASYDTKGRRLRVLKRGGPLDVYEGRLFDDVEKKLRNWQGF